jgi:thymidylate synthase (FAD)
LQIPVLDHGYVHLVNIFGSELDIVNAARLSYNKSSDYLDEKDIKLINFLIRENHTSPFRHVHLSIEFNSPLMVARQHWRHTVGAATLEDGTPFSELSRRYVRGVEEFYIPTVDQWRSAPENSKQGSGGSVGMYKGAKYYQAMIRTVTEAHSLYLEALEDGIAPEQARLLLPAYAMYTKYLWTPSLHAALNFIEMRSANDSQYEMREYSKAVESIIEESFPNVYSAFRRKTI